MSRWGPLSARTALLALLAVMVQVLLAPTAFAHTRLVDSDPADGTSLDTSPQVVTLTFSEDVPADFIEIEVIGPDGRGYADGSPTSEGPVVTIKLAPLGPAGDYRVEYELVSADGHPVSGVTTFSVTSAGDGDGRDLGSSPDGEEDQGSRTAVVLGAAGAVVVVVLVGAVVLRRRRSSGSGTDSV